MNSGGANSAGSKGSGNACTFSQHMVNQRPCFERQVLSRKRKVYRPDKRGKKPKFI
jgi:hypothetical protein